MEQGFSKANSTNLPRIHLLMLGEFWHQTKTFVQQNLEMSKLPCPRPSYGDDAEEAVKSIECHDCVASQGGCKHAIAFLMWIHRRSEEPSCTSVECYWMKSKLSRAGSTLKYLTAREMSNAKPICHQIQKYLKSF
ncbi:hypothetical protein EVAR_60490_1 [Eumeta japonica]|uniref:SWIM-type domain-containing protein n=1 Tax=Eumeta variegata TaxID=151549 RepID=A0A4C1ZWF1_EUMVA|nr:hypothetical protein EVAR_60490_1 [Eumeta japonica]